MKILKYNYKFYLEEVKTKIKEANLQENSAEWLFKNDLRTPFFMLQAISRISNGVYKSKKILNLNKEFKLVEDQLGKIDYFNQCLENVKLDKEQTTYYQEKIVTELEVFKNILDKKDWLNKKRILKIEAFLKDFKWLNEKAEIKKIKEFYNKAIKQIRVVIEDENYKFEDIEHNIHEFRRDLRWLSIYLKATNGLFKAVKFENETDLLDIYFTEEVLNSPHIQLDSNPKIKNNIFIDYSNLIALSWLINELGNLKDKGLLDLEFNNTSNASKEKLVLLNRRIKYILNKAQKIVSQFNKDQVLENLLIKK